MDDFNHLLGGVERTRYFAADGAGADPCQELPDDREMDVRPEKRQPHPAQRGIHARLAQHTAAREVLEDFLKSSGQYVQHDEN
jgi:hypothetical protein